MNLDKFIRNEEKIRKLLARRQKGRYLSKARISRVIRKLNYRQDTNVIYQLEKNDPGFLKLARRNQELLTTRSLELKAQNNKLLQLIALLIMIAGTALIIFLLRDYLFHPEGSLYLFAVIIAIPSFMFRIITKSEQQKLKRFNRYKLRQ